MNYEKKYNEALERATKLHEGLKGYNANREVIENIFPELAESEDEGIMSRIIDGFKNFSRSASKWNNIPVEEVIAYLEKQKENPKSADSIPSDCISDAKCEDRWHKVGDSLPDNPREVLCKDEAGNYFIGRYYVGEGWEISNYDDEDKPHHLNPPVSKWIDFPLEKQKDLTTENIYKHSRERMSFWNGQQKEQKPVEWSEEDEKMLNEVLDMVTYAFYEQGNEGEIENNPAFLWLHKLRPSWKPSEEQMKALLNAEGFLRAGLQHDSAKTIAELYEQLKKL